MSENMENNNVNTNSQPVVEPPVNPQIVNTPIETLQESPAPVQNTPLMPEHAMNEQTVEPVKEHVVQNEFGMPVYNKNDDKKRYGFLAILVVIIIALIAFLTYFIINSNNPTKYYQSLVKYGINEFFAVIDLDEKQINTTMNLDLDLDLEDGMMDQEIIDLINKIELEFNGQLDRDKEQVVLKINSNYEKEKLLNLELYVDSKDEKTYLYAKDYIDKYLEIELEDYSDIKNVLDSESVFKSEASKNKAEKVLIKELTAVITKEDCYKEDDYLVFEITQEKLYEKLEKAFENLKDNKDFIGYFEDADTAEETIEELVLNFDPEYASEETMKILIKKSGLFNKVEEVIVEFVDTKMEFEIEGDIIEFEIESYDEKVLSGSVEITERKNSTNTKMTFKIPEVGKIKVNLETENIYGKDVDTINKSKVKKIEELTENDQQQIMEKLEDSKLYDLIMSFVPTYDDYDYDYGYDNDYDNNLNINNNSNVNTINNEVELHGSGKKVSFNVPSGYTLTYNDENFKTYKNGEISVTVMANYDEPVDEYLNGLDDDLDFYTSYQNVNLTNKMSKIVNGNAFYYRTLSYDYVGYTTTHYYETFVITQINSEDYITIEIYSQNSQISDSDLEAFLTLSY